MMTTLPYEDTGGGGVHLRGSGFNFFFQQFSMEYKYFLHLCL